MTAEAEEVPLCGLHHLKFVELKEFPEDTPDFSDVLGSYASNRCKARACRRDGTLNRVPLCGCPHNHFLGSSVARGSELPAATAPSVASSKA